MFQMLINEGQKNTPHTKSFNFSARLHPNLDFVVFFMKNPPPTLGIIFFSFVQIKSSSSVTSKVCLYTISEDYNFSDKHNFIFPLPPLYEKVFLLDNFLMVGICRKLLTWGVFIRTSSPPFL